MVKAGGSERGCGSRLEYQSEECGPGLKDQLRVWSRAGGSE